MAVPGLDRQPALGGRPLTILALRPDTGNILDSEETGSGQIELSVVDNHFAALLMLPEVQPAALLVPADAAAASRVDFLRAVLAWTRLPVVIGLTAASADEFVVEAVALGVKHFVYLPCPLSAIITEIGGLRPADDVLRLGGAELDAAGLTVAAGQRRVQLTVQQFAVLHKLCTAYPRMVSFEELCAEGDHTVQSMRQVIRRVREVLSSGQIPLAVESVRGRGYRLTVPPTVEIDR